MRMKTWGLLALKIAFSGALIWYFVGKSDLGVAMENLRRVDTATVSLTIALFLATLGCGESVESVEVECWGDDEYGQSTPPDLWPKSCAGLAANGCNSPAQSSRKFL